MNAKDAFYYFAGMGLLFLLLSLGEAIGQWAKQGFPGLK